MGVLDAYDTFVDKECEKLQKEAGTFEQVTGLGALVNGLEAFHKDNIIGTLLNSPLRTLGEDFLAEQINETTRRVSQSVSNAVSCKRDAAGNAINPTDARCVVANTLTDMRSMVFNTAFTLMTLQNDMVLLFAARTAKKTVREIRKKRTNLIELQEAIRKLHNALLRLAGGGPFFNEYLAQLRQALILLDDADLELELVRSAFISTNSFPAARFENAKFKMDAAYDLMVPPLTKDENEALKARQAAKGGGVEGFLKGVIPSKDELKEGFGERLSMMTIIPKLTLEMLKKYDAYAIKVLQVNVHLLGFQSIVRNLEEVTAGKLGKVVTDVIDKSRTELGTVITNMALDLNGDKEAIDGPILIDAGSTSSGGFKARRPGEAEILAFAQAAPGQRFFSPNPTKTSAKAIKWAIQVKSSRLILDVIESNAFKNLDSTNEALRFYNSALEALAELDERRTPLAVLKATDGREEVGDIEADFITFAFQSNQALLDASLLDSTSSGFGPKTVLALGAKLNSRLQLSIDQDREVEQILLQYVAKTQGLETKLGDSVNSIFKFMDDLGMDFATDLLGKGDISEFFNLNGKTASFIGAALAGLNILKPLLTGQEQKGCIDAVTDRLTVAETSKNLASQRTVGTNYVKLQRRNEIKCNTLKDEKARVDGCASGIDFNELFDNPAQALGGIFRGVFGGDISQGLFGSAGGTFFSTDAASLEAADNIKAAGGAVSSAKESMATAIATAGEAVDTATSTFDEVSKKFEEVQAAVENPQGALLEQFQQAGADKFVADDLVGEANSSITNLANKADPFGSNVGAVSDVVGGSGVPNASEFLKVPGLG